MESAIDFQGCKVLMTPICQSEQKSQGQIKDSFFSSALAQKHGEMQADAGKAIDICSSLQIVEIKEEGEAGVALPGAAHPHVLMHAGGHGWPAEKSISGDCCQDVWTTRATAGAHPFFLCPPQSCPAGVFFFIRKRRGEGGALGAGGGVEDEGESGLGGLLFAYV